MVLIILHHHFRPGGVRRVIELAAPHLVASSKGLFTKVVLAGGEEPDAAWLARFRARLAGVRTDVFVKEEFGYISEIRPSGSYATRLRHAVLELFGGCAEDGCVVWAHNLGLGRNLCLARQLSHYCHIKCIPLVMHQHDWWFENRWHLFSEYREPCFKSLRGVAQATLPDSPAIRFALINRSDAKLLAKHFRGRVAWLPNPVESTEPPSEVRVRNARDWLTQQLGDSAPVWLMPCRLLRRKNIAEAVLLARWLRPEAWLVTTGGPSSAQEQGYANTLAAAAEFHGWRLKLAVLQGDPPGNPTVEELIAASEAILLTSVQEGFGLTYLEATAARRPLIARKLPNIAPDLARFGFEFPHYYNEVLIEPCLFDWGSEYARQRQLYSHWKAYIPKRARSLMDKLFVLKSGPNPCPVPFSKLTLKAQLEVLAVPPSESWEKCAPLNRFLIRWRKLASTGQLKAGTWPATADKWLGGNAYAKTFFKLLEPVQIGRRKSSSVAAQEDFLRTRLRSENLYPILWETIS